MCSYDGQFKSGEMISSHVLKLSSIPDADTTLTHEKFDKNISVPLFRFFEQTFDYLSSVICMICPPKTTSINSQGLAHVTRNAAPESGVALSQPIPPIYRFDPIVGGCFCQCILNYFLVFADPINQIVSVIRCKSSTIDECFLHSIDEETAKSIGKWESGLASDVQHYQMDRKVCLLVA